MWNLPVALLAQSACWDFSNLPYVNLIPFNLTVTGTRKHLLDQ
jgi:hypothetical protein